MPRYTPLYRLPALSPTDRARQIADLDWANAQAIEGILANQGQPPLGSDLVSLIKRLNALETPGPVPYWFGANINNPSQAVASGWNLFNQAIVPQTNIGGWTWSAGALTVPQDGFYWVQGGFVAANGTTGNRGIQASVNNTLVDRSVVFKNELQGFGNVQGQPYMLAKGDVLRFFYNSGNVSGNLGSNAGDTFIKVYRIGAKG